ncbi:FtsK/SpoIIIE domain-containing protein [Singulisphaera sp. PoT]|uniref:FtsK/SpoIIIE domain-containing protein n=1 Tax=Singulisphaera sp. PoT TaxID=3411797 RepID=UPI003BF5D2D0
MLFENPFRESRLNNSRNFRPEWDVPELNQGITKWLVEEVSRLRGRSESDPGQMIATMIGPPGYGKTHLFGRIEHLIGHEVFFVFVPAFEERTAPLDHIRWHVIEALFRSPEGGHSPLELGLARICRPAFAAYFANLPPTLAARHETMHRRLDEHSEAVLEIVKQVKNLEPFAKLADSLIQILPQDAGIVRALALGWAPTPWSGTARRWLQGQDLPDLERSALNLPEEPPTALEVIRSIPALFSHERPMMICCDQIEALLQGDNADAINRFSSSMMDLLQAVPVQLVLSCFKDQWDKFYKNAFSAFKMRVKQPEFKLERLQPEQGLRLIKSRLTSWSGRQPDRDATWPIKNVSISQLVREHGPTPRALIQKCDSELSKWIEEGSQGEIDLTNGDEPTPINLERLFINEWNREVEVIRQAPERAASYLPEDRLYRGVLEALKLANSAQRMRNFGGVRIVDVRDKAVRATASNPRPGAMVTLAGGPGEESQSILVALSKQEATKSLGHYFNAIFNASADPVVGAVVIHPKRDLDLGPQARTNVNAALKEGRLRIMPLEDFPMTYYATECLAALLERANAREFILEGVTLSAEDCRDLVIKTGLIDNLDLFKMLGRWKRAGARPSKPSDTAALVSNGNHAVPVTSPAPQTVPASVAPPAPKPIPEPKVAPGSSDKPPVKPKPDTDTWAATKLTEAVKKLNLLGQSVEEDGFEVGPTFARLRVRPMGKTNFKGVSNKAVDLRISLGLKVVPIVGSQAGCISIDIQLPDRSVVKLDEALADPPQSLQDLPAFPVGKDVTGQSHWLNLAEPSDCHILVAGTTGSGKSEFLRATIGAMASRLSSDRLQFVLIDPKRVTFNLRGTSPYLRFPVAYSLDEALPTIESCMAEMDRRYRLLEAKKLSNVSQLPPELLPRIVIVIDEFASFLEDKESKKVTVDLLKRIGAMARAAGIHLILSTQRPDKDVVTPLLRENLPGRIALSVSSKAGSDLILGSPEAENLLGKGDLFWKRGGELLRLQSPYVTQEELERILKIEG